MRVPSQPYIFGRLTHALEEIGKGARKQWPPTGADVLPAAAVDARVGRPPADETPEERND